MRRGRAWMGVVRVLACVAAAATTVAAAAPPGKSAALDDAVAALKREYAAHVKDPKSAPLRKSCDYFADEDARSRVSLDALLTALEKPVSGANARQMAYVKRQLLSALPPTPDDDTVRRLLKAYERAPVPALRYGASKQDMRALDAMIDPDRAHDDVRLNEGLEQAAARAAALDLPVIAYRDELYSRLPAGRDKFVAALRDAHARLSVAGEKEELAARLLTELPAWASTAASDDAGRSAVREVAELLGRLRFVQSPPYYAYASVRSGRLGWRTRTDTLLTKAKFAGLHKQVLDAAGVPPVAVDAGPGARQASKSTK